MVHYVMPATRLALLIDSAAAVVEIAEQYPELLDKLTPAARHWVESAPQAFAALVAVPLTHGVRHG